MVPCRNAWEPCSELRKFKSQQFEGWWLLTTIQFSILKVLFHWFSIFDSLLWHLALSQHPANSQARMSLIANQNPRNGSLPNQRQAKCRQYIAKTPKPLNAETIEQKISTIINQNQISHFIKSSPASFLFWIKKSISKVHLELSYFFRTFNHLLVKVLICL